MMSRATGPEASPPCLPLSWTRTETTISGSRRVTDKPRIVFKFLFFSDAIAGSVTDDLGGSGFSAELNPREFQLTASAARFVDDAPHGVGELSNGWFRDRKPLLTDILGIFQHMRLFENAARGDSTNQAGQL